MLDSNVTAPDCGHGLVVPAMANRQDLTAIRLKERMEELGTSARSLAEDIGVSPGAISHILTGRSRDSRHLPKIATHLSVNLNWLLGLTDDKIDMFDDKGEDIYVTIEDDDLVEEVFEKFMENAFMRKL